MVLTLTWLPCCLVVQPPLARSPHMALSLCVVCLSVSLWPVTILNFVFLNLSCVSPCGCTWLTISWKNTTHNQTVSQDAYLVPNRPANQDLEVTWNPDCSWASWKLWARDMERYTAPAGTRILGIALRYLSHLGCPPRYNQEELIPECEKKNVKNISGSKKKKSSKTKAKNCFFSCLFFQFTFHLKLWGWN